jgi:hypothetical protein
VKCLPGVFRAPDLTCEYLDDDLDDRADGYWQSRSSSFRRLAKLARMFYSTRSERSCSVARSAIGTHRLNLLAESLPILMVLHTNKTLVESSIKNGKWL